MIRSFRHKGLERFYKKAERRGLQASMTDKIARILARLDVIVMPAQMDLPGWRLHPLNGAQKGFWSVWVTGTGGLFFGSRAGCGRC
ncbi:MAG: type II toxin-antitoxin system RelE/ParE family toxin [Casimicrobiaceae bacterium]